jgi:hypothetical protein
MAAASGGAPPRRPAADHRVQLLAIVHLAPFVATDMPLQDGPHIWSPAQRQCMNLLGAYYEPVLRAGITATDRCGAGVRCRLSSPPLPALLCWRCRVHVHADVSRDKRYGPLPLPSTTRR